MMFHELKLQELIMFEIDISIDTLKTLILLNQ